MAEVAYTLAALRKRRTLSVDFLPRARNTVVELNSRGDSLARERRWFVTYQAEPHEVSTATGFSWQTEDGRADWPGDLAGNGAGKDETGSDIITLKGQMQRQQEQKQQHPS
ncbi:uncharacterized protein LOC122527348 isoform X2 [Frieseomelitta varia]|uniref:uncharacterized protein LOC122527348 isoform X2 n=1 Tax=Frieseomelitta varia TaxID=561572 RepID=UPI001CB6AF97|nr:uncharacterized protein LOC122527348 isoform X2 [Frieseomelitta varia]